MAERRPFNRRRYIEAGQPISFSGRSNVRRYVRPKPTAAHVEEFLSTIDSYTLHREPKKIKYNPIFVHRLRELIQMDLCDKHLESAANDGYKYWLVVQDTFSRKAFVRPLKNKGARTVSEAMEDVLQDMNLRGVPEKCYSDRGTEFKNRHFKQLLDHYNIKQLFAIFHASHVERLLRSLQSMVAKYQTAHQTDRYIHILQATTEAYNNRYHRIIKMSPEQAERTRNGDAVRLALSEYYQKARESKIKPKYKKGLWVRVQNVKGAFFRSYQQTFGEYMYQIHKVHTNLPRPMYELVDSAGELQNDRYYQEELQPVGGELFKVNKLLGRRRNKRTGEWERFVNWVGFLPDTGTWEAESTLNLQPAA